MKVKARTRYPIPGARPGVWVVVEILHIHKWSRWAEVLYQGAVFCMKKWYLRKLNGRRFNWRRYSYTAPAWRSGEAQAWPRLHEPLNPPKP